MGPLSFAGNLTDAVADEGQMTQDKGQGTIFAFPL
jgi:hypothetical protein